MGGCTTHLHSQDPQQAPLYEACTRPRGGLAPPSQSHQVSGGKRNQQPELKSWEAGSSRWEIKEGCLEEEYHEGLGAQVVALGQEKAPSLGNEDQLAGLGKGSKILKARKAQAGMKARLEGPLWH